MHVKTCQMITHISSCISLVIIEGINNREGITELYKKLTQVKVQLPISLSALLRQKQQEIVITLCKHYKQCRTQPENI
jgi:hypothetical protein